MRFLAIGIVCLLAVAPASAQTPGSSHPYGLDPYAPSDAMWLRTYGAALVAQTPLLEIAALDPYKPSEAALMRQVGGAMPLCCLNWNWPGLVLGSPVPTSLRGLRAAPMVAFATQLAAPVAPVQAMAPATPMTSQTASTAVATLARPGSNTGVSIRYRDQVWTSAGRAVPLEASSFERAGELSGFPVYRRVGATDDLIYVPTRGNLIAPYRLRP